MLANLDLINVSVKNWELERDLVTRNRNQKQENNTHVLVPKKGWRCPGGGASERGLRGGGKN